MPTSTRPTSALFWQIVKGAVVDSSLKRLTSSEAGKNLSVVFAYFTQLSFHTLLETKLPSGKTGIEILTDGASVMKFLMDADLPLQSYEIRVVERLFDSFVKDGALEIKYISDTKTYYFKEKIPPLEKNEYNEILKTNKYLVYAGEDIISNLIESLKQGDGVVDMGDRGWAFVAEAMYQDHLFQASRREATDYILKDSLKFLDDDKISVMSLHGGAGHSIIHFLDYFVRKYPGKQIIVNGCDQSSINMARTKINLRSFLIENRSDKSTELLHVRENLKVLSNKEDWYERFGNQIRKIDIFISSDIFTYLEPEKLELMIKRVSEMIHEKGVVVLFQPTSYSDDFPLPLYSMFCNMKGFYDIPTKAEVNRICNKYFNSVKAHQLESVWTLKKPKKL